MYLKEQKRSLFIFSIASSLVTIVLVNTVPLWIRYTNGVILETWVNILWAVNLSLIVQIAGNAVLLFHRPVRLYSVLKAVMTAVSLLSMLVFLIVFPMDFTPVGAGGLNTALKVVIVVGLGLGLIGLVTYVVKAAVGAAYADERPKA